MIRVGIAGMAGKIGRVLAPLVAGDPDLPLVGCVVRSTSTLDLDEAPTIAQDPAWYGAIVSEPAQLAGIADVVIDFTSPHATLALAKACAECGCALVAGTTGFSLEERASLESCAEAVPIFASASFSLGIAAMSAVPPALATALAEFDLAIGETHHRGKRDAPSGAALALASVIERALGERASGGGGVAIHALRLGGSPDEHTIVWASDDEEVTIAHRAFNRRSYATGAIHAARFVVGRPPGLYTMRDLLVWLT